ncbi:zinc finger protein 567-like isoform X1 [Rana temporaria]|uniref:zinc finger protein 567-like isoform X1 n=1 Tax=Rana temporaria TaxID=8407 RepID=UPI001AAE0981|nr:zinc finger protein 567-like isoform X1 [Rana temporaria]XP_040176940.1 zinc finger protein 567-like isoform X1 [Rana temporaria]
MESISQTTVFLHQSQRNRITEDKNNLTKRLLHLAIQLLCLQTEERYVILKKFGPLNNRVSRSRSSIMECPPPSLIPENKKILEATNKIIELLTGEVPIRYQDLTVYFSMEEWEYIEEHEDLFTDVLLENQQLFGLIGCFKRKRRSETTSGSGKSGNCRAEAVLNVTKELIDLLTGESFILVKTSRTMTDKQSSGYLGRGQDGIIESLPDPTIPERNRQILEATNMILELLTGEVPIRCQDIAVHFSMKEWEYLEGHRDLYKDDDMENSQPFISLDGGLPAYEPDGYPLPARHLEEGNKNLFVMKSTQSRTASVDENGGGNISSPKESVQAVPVSTKSPVSNNAAHCIKEENFPCSECGICFSSQQKLDFHRRLHMERKTYSCTECDKIFLAKLQLESHQMSHTGIKRVRCAECHKSFATKGSLTVHQQRHCLEAQYYRCSPCRQDFETKQELEDHMKNHLKSQATCTECGKRFLNKGNLKAHYRIHTGEKPFVCLECGKSFTYKSHLVSHQRFHTGEGLTCRYCEMFFADRARLVEHERVHTGEKPFACSECGRRFNRKYHLVMHLRTHTDIRPFGCTACGMLFTSHGTAERHLTQRRCKKQKALKC